MKRAAARNRRKPAPAPATLATGSILTLADLLEAFLPTVAESTHPAFRSTLRLAARICAGTEDLTQVPLDRLRGFPQTWAQYLKAQLAAGPMKPAAAQQYRSRVDRLVRWAMEVVYPQAPLLLRDWLLALSQLDAPRHALLAWTKTHGSVSERAALRQFFLFLDRAGHRLEDLATQGPQLTQAYAEDLDAQPLEHGVRLRYYGAFLRALRRLQAAQRLPAFVPYLRPAKRPYRLPWTQFPHQELQQQVRFFYDHACVAALKRPPQWPWDPVSPETRKQIIQFVERYVGFLVHHYPGGGLDLCAMTLDELFSQQHLGAFRVFYLSRNGQVPNRGLTGTFEGLQTFTYRVLHLDTERFHLLYDPLTPPRPDFDQQRTIPELLAYLPLIKKEIQQHPTPRWQLSLQRFFIYTRLLIATGQRIDSLVQVHVDHLQRDGQRYLLNLPPEHLKQTNHHQATWRQIPLPEDLTADLEQYLNHHRPDLLNGHHSPYLFPLLPPRDGHVNDGWLNSQLARIDRIAHPDHAHATSSHKVRKTISTAMIRHQGSQGAFHASKVLGHVSTQTTRKHYLDGKGTALIQRDWRIRELLSRIPLTDRDLKDVAELIYRDPTDWTMLKKGMKELAPTIPS